MGYKNITVEGNIRPYYQSSALAHKPCSRGTQYHALDCGHTVVDPSVTGCASNCVEPGVYADGSSPYADHSSHADKSSSDMSFMDIDITSSSSDITSSSVVNFDIRPNTFLCVLCVLKQYCPWIDEDTVPNDDVRSLLCEVGNAHFENASEDLAAATSKHRYSEPSKPWDWLYDFTARNPGVMVGEEVELPGDDWAGPKGKWLRYDPDKEVSRRMVGRPLAQVRVLLRERAAENEREARTMNLERGLLHAGGELPRLLE